MVNSPDYRASDDRQSSEKLDRHEMKWLWPSFNYYPVMSLDRSRKSMRNLNQDSSSPGHIFSPRPAGQQ